jgi:tetratricopeptide (TPR) repeat protein
MMNRPRSTAPPLLLALLLAFSGTQSLAANATDRATARRAFERGSRLYQQARYAEAAAAFEEAYRAVPNGVVLYNLGQCYEKLGELEKALSSYREYLRLVPQAEDREAVQTIIASLEGRLEAVKRPKVTLSSEPSGALVSLDGQERGPTPWSEPVEVGTHQLSLALKGYQPLRRELEVRAGEPVQLHLVLTSIPEVTPAPTPAAVAQPSPRGRTWTWVAAGAAGAAAAGAVSLGLLARADSRELLARPHERAEAQALHDSARGKSRTANVLYGVAGVAAAAGVTLFFVEGSF